MTSEEVVVKIEPSSNNNQSKKADEESKVAEVGLSKRAIKRIAKIAAFEEAKKQKRIKTRLKRKEQKIKQKISGIDNVEGKIAQQSFTRKALKRKKMDKSKCDISVVIDLSFDSLMSEKEIHKTVKQVHRCYSINRRQPDPLQFHVTSFSGKSSDIMKKHDGFTNWDVKFHEEDFDNIFEKESIVYLTSDSENTLQNLEPKKVYILGGLVDYGKLKGVCLKSAIDKKVSHARLPLSELINMNTRKVLTTVHVFEILALVSQGSSWEEALIKVIPPRKNAELKNSS